MAYDIRNIRRGAGGGYASGGYNPENIQAMLASQGKYTLQTKAQQKGFDLAELAAALNRERFTEQKRATGVAESQSERSYQEQLEREELQKTLWGFLQGGGTALERPEFFEKYTGFTGMPTGGPASRYGGTGGGRYAGVGGSYGGGANYGKMSPTMLAKLAIRAREQRDVAKAVGHRGVGGSDWEKVRRNIMEYLT